MVELLPAVSKLSFQQSLMQSNQRQSDRIATVLISSIAILVAMAPLPMLWSIFADGLPSISLTFIFAEPTDVGRGGGIFPLIIATLLILAVALIAALPIGLGCAVYLSECVPPDSKQAKWIGHSLDILSGVPSIVFGLFGYAVFAIQMGLGFSILSGGLSLGCMMLPLFIRISEQALRACPLSYRQAAAVMNISLSGFLRRILLPTAAYGIAAAVVISIGRALAESAVLIFTAGYVMRMPDSLFDSGRALAVHIYDLSMNVSGGQPHAAATAVVLVITIIVINLTARYLAARFSPDAI